MKKLNFAIPFNGFAGTSFLNCFSCVYMFLEGIDAGKSDYDCPQLKGKSCNSCGNCAKGGYTPISRQECWFFLFDTMCGRSSLRCRFDGTPTEMQRMIGDPVPYAAPYEGGTDDSIDFLFGFAGYAYRKATEGFQDEIAASINAGRPVIAKAAKGMRVIIGYDKEKLLEPDYKNAQNLPKKAKPVKLDELEALYIISEKIEPRFKVMDGLQRIKRVMEYNMSEKLWDGYIEKMGLYTADSLGSCDAEEKQARMKRVKETMWHTWNCHNFGQVFRQYRKDGDPTFYDGISDMHRLNNPALTEHYDRISGPCCGYTHDLAWALVGLEEVADWKKNYTFRMGYTGEMVELVLAQIKKNDEACYEAICKIITVLEENH